VGVDRLTRAIVEAAPDQGFRVEETRDGWMIYPPDPAMSPVSLHRTPSDRRATRNALSLLRKRGFRWPE
jgi:hypothetical protein